MTVEQQDEIERLRSRLEIDPRHDMDGIDTRDRTIRELCGVVEKLMYDDDRGSPNAWRDYFRDGCEYGMRLTGIHIRSDGGDDRDVTIKEQRKLIERLRASGSGRARHGRLADLADKLHDRETRINELRAALVAAMEIVRDWRAINTWQDRQVPEIYGFCKKLDAVIAQADAALGSER